MTQHTCTDCHEPIPNGQAHTRSVSFKQVARCGFCHAVANGTALLTEMTVPEQRKPSALVARLDAARRAR